MKIFVAFALLFAVTALAQTSRKVLVEDDGTGTCLLGADDFSNPIVPKTVAAVGTISGSSACFDAFVSGQNFTNAYESIRLGKSNKDCNRQIRVQLTYASPAGKTGMLDNWVAQPASATNPCVHNGKLYRKYTADQQN